MFKIKLLVYVTGLFILFTFSFIHAATKMPAEEMLKQTSKKSTTQLKVEEMLKNNQAGCGKELENNEFKANLDKIPPENRFLQELSNGYKRRGYNLYDTRTGEFVIGIRYFSGPVCEGIFLHGFQASKTNKRNLPKN
jgi:hypothetical protein